MRRDIQRAFTVVLAAVLILFAAHTNALAAQDQPLTQQMLDSKVKLIDIRTQSEWEQSGIVKGSYTLTFFDEKGGYDAKAFLAGLDKIVKKNETFGVICRSGNRTGKIIDFLRSSGYVNAFDVKGGINLARQNGINTVPYK